METAAAAVQQAEAKLQTGGTESFLHQNHRPHGCARHRPHGATGKLRAARPGVAGAGAEGRLGDRQFQGNAVDLHARRDSRSNCAWMLIRTGNSKASVDSLQAGTGARFSLLPPENAVGNYVKVVQRVPVKIVFDEPLPTNLDIAPGMSVEPEVKVK